MNAVKKLLFLFAQTPLHVGSGKEEGPVDLPFQRDEFDFPVIWASSVKGAIKSYLRDNSSNDQADMMNLKKALGKDPGEEGEEFVSAVSFTDAKLLLIPGRSLKNIWLYLTSTHILTLYRFYSEDTECKVRDELNKLSNMNSNTMLGNFKSYSIDDTHVFVNETEISVEKKDDKTQFPLPDSLSSVLPKKDVLILHEELSKEIINKSMSRQYRIVLDKNTKTAQNLWSEEYAPQFSIFVSTVVCKGFKDKTANNQICEWIKGKTDGRSLWIGGRETIGKGLVKLFWC